MSAGAIFCSSKWSQKAVWSRRGEPATGSPWLIKSQSCSLLAIDATWKQHREGQQPCPAAVNRGLSPEKLHLHQPMHITAYPPHTAELPWLLTPSGIQRYELQHLLQSLNSHSGCLGAGKLQNAEFSEVPQFWASLKTGSGLPVHMEQKPEPTHSAELRALPCDHPILWVTCTTRCKMANNHEFH